MIRFENTTVIDRPAAQVFDFLADLENLPRWNYAVVETEKISDGSVGVGIRYRQVREFLGRRIEDQFEVTAYEPAKRLAIESTVPGLFPFAFVYELAPVHGNTRITNSVTLEPQGALRLASPLVASRVKSAVDANLARLKEIIESS
ncbi:MAG: hypothetical protein Kow00120_25500 [Anaerolineae bacterium]